MLYFYYINSFLSVNDVKDKRSILSFQTQIKVLCFKLKEDLKNDPDIKLGQVFQTEKTFSESIKSSTAVKLSDIDFIINDIIVQLDEQKNVGAIVIDVSFIESGKLYPKIKPYIPSLQIIPAMDTVNDKIICFGLILPPYVKL